MKIFVCKKVLRLDKYEGEETMNQKEKEYLRSLAKKVAEYSETEENQEKARAWRAHNDLKSGARAMVLCDPENGWNEIFPASAYQCESPDARYWEFILRRDLYSFEELKDDRVLERKVYVSIVSRSTGWGLNIKHKTVEVNGAYHVEPVLDDYGKMELMHYPEIIYDKEATTKGLEETKELFRDILDVETKGVFWWSLGLSNQAIEYRGLENFMFDMYDYPDELHVLMNFLCEGNLKMLESLEKQGMLYQNTENCYVGSGGYGFTDSLKKVTDRLVTPKDMWGFTESQETVSVSPKMFEEFIFPYQLKIAEKFGLNCYGCCEPLDLRWKIVKKIPNLRRVSVSHWANAKKMAEYLSNNYIFSLKPSPSYLAIPQMNAEAAEQELHEKVGYARANNCHIEIIMKDNHTLGNNPQNAVNWVKIAKKVLNE